MRETSSSAGTRGGSQDVALAAEHERLDRDLELEPAALAGAEVQAREVEAAGCWRQASPRLATLTPLLEGRYPAALSSRLSTLPVALRGSSSTNTTSRGTL